MRRVWQMHRVPAGEHDVDLCPRDPTCP